MDWLIDWLIDTYIFVICLFGWFRWLCCWFFHFVKWFVNSWRSLLASFATVYFSLLFHRLCTAENKNTRTRTQKAWMAQLFLSSFTKPPVPTPFLAFVSLSWCQNQRTDAPVFIRFCLHNPPQHSTTPLPPSPIPPQSTLTLIPTHPKHLTYLSSEAMTGRPTTVRKRDANMWNEFLCLGYHVNTIIDS